MPLALPVPWMETAPLVVAVTVAPPLMTTPSSWPPEPPPLPLRDTPPASALTWELMVRKTPALAGPEPLPPVPVMVTTPWPVACTVARILM